MTNSPQVFKTRAQQLLHEKVQKAGTQRDFEIVSGVSQGTISKLLAGATPGRTVELKLEKVGIRRSYWLQPPKPPKAHEPDAGGAAA